MPNAYLPGVITIPSTLLITNITQSSPMVVTVDVGNSSTETNTYIVGMAVRLFVPWDYGMWQANNLVGTILEIDGLDFTIDLTSTYFDVFSVPSGNVAAPATLCPNGSRNLQYSNDTNAVPFQSLNNIGN